MPSFQSITPSIVEKDQIGRGLALNSAQFNLSRILGPAIAGVLMASLGAAACFALSAASYIPFIGVALWILPRGGVSKPYKEPFASGQLLADLGQIARASIVRHALLTVLATSLLVGPVVTFAPALIGAAFHCDAAQFSATVAALGIGGLLGAMALLALPPGLDRLRRSSLLAAAAGLAAAMIAVSPWLWAVAALMALAGAAMTMSNTTANSLLQTMVRQDMLGRTASFYMLAMRGGLPLGSLHTGLSVERFGIRDALLINGALAFAARRNGPLLAAVERLGNLSPAVDSQSMRRRLNTPTLTRSKANMKPTVAAKTPPTMFSGKGVIMRPVAAKVVTMAMSVAEAKTITQAGCDRQKR
jgi:predicted MFS family arabinose efflux permease